jgi:hypothetical protein
MRFLFRNFTFLTVTLGVIELIILKKERYHILSGNFFCGRIGVWTQGLHLEPLHSPFCVFFFFYMGYPKLFALADFEL